MKLIYARLDHMHIEAFECSQLQPLLGLELLAMSIEMPPVAISPFAKSAMEGTS